MTSSLNVLVVDDSSANRRLMQAMLKKMGHRVMLAEDGAESLAMCEQQMPDLVLMDVSMPVMNGFDAVTEMRRRYAGWFPILFLSAQTSNKEVVEGLRAGGDDYLFKPIDYEILQAKIHNFQVRVEQNRSLLDYRERIVEENDTAREFIKQFTALDKIQDPLIRFFLEPAESFSGDLIAVARRPDNGLHVLLADSAGHGLTAALAVIPITQPFYQMTEKGFDLPAIVRELNRRVREYLPLPRFVAAAMLSLDPETGVIQVWNGGCPSVLLLDAEGEEIRHRFKSRHLPLGVVAPTELDASMEYHKLDDRPSCLLLCSDGATEISLQDKPNGQEQDGVLSWALHSSKGAFFDRLVDGIQRHLGESAPADDIALIVLDCPGTDLNRPLTGSPESDHPDAGGCQYGEDDKSVWHFSLTLTARQLSYLDVVPFLLNVTGQIENGKADGRLFLVLSELFNNALDHGLLKLDSALKNMTDGMELYFEERTERLAELSCGEIVIRLDKLDCGRMKVYVKDSGEGFDYARLLSDNMVFNRQRHGRGIELLSSICSTLKYSGSGSEVLAYLRLTQPEPV